jgi:hypothetical protein
MVSKCWDGSLHNIELPTGKTVLVGNERKEKVECELFWFKIFDPLFGSQSMINPRKGS